MHTDVHYPFPQTEHNIINKSQYAQGIHCVQHSHCSEYSRYTSSWIIWLDILLKVWLIHPPPGTHCPAQTNRKETSAFAASHRRYDFTRRSKLCKHSPGYGKTGARNHFPSKKLPPDWGSFEKKKSKQRQKMTFRTVDLILSQEMSNCRQQSSIWND